MNGKTAGGNARMERVLRPGEKVYDLVDIIEDEPEEPAFVQERKSKVAVVNVGVQEEILNRVTETTERIAREMIPDIVERVIREEIEKLKHP